VRRYREGGKGWAPREGTANVGPRVRVELPLPCPSRRGEEGEDALTVRDEGYWPGGVMQKFRAQRPLVEAMLEGYGPDFLGVVEEEPDGVGVWRCGPDLTCVCNVNDLTFNGFARLCRGDYGARPTEEGHTILAVNCSWTAGANIGQLWDRDLKRRARAIIDDSAWEWVYFARALRTSRGNRGVLLRAWPGPWELYRDVGAGAREWGFGGIGESNPPVAYGELVLSSEARPDAAAITAALAAQPL